MSDDPTWRLQQQAGQLARLFADAGLTGAATLAPVAQLGEQLDQRADLTAEAEVLGETITRRSADGFDQLTQLQRQLDTTDLTLQTVSTELRRAVHVETAAAALGGELLAELQAIRDA